MTNATSRRTSRFTAINNAGKWTVTDNDTGETCRLSDNANKFAQTEIGAINMSMGVCESHRWHDRNGRDQCGA